MKRYHRLHSLHEFVVEAMTKEVLRPSNWKTSYGKFRVHPRFSFVIQFGTGKKPFLKYFKRSKWIDIAEIVDDDVNLTDDRFYTFFEPLVKDYEKYSGRKCRIVLAKHKEFPWESS